MEKFGVRWNTVRSAAWRAMTGMDWMPDEPVPITPTRIPSKRTSSLPHRAVWWVRPRYRSRPPISGSLAADRHPVAMIRNWARAGPPGSVCTVQLALASSQSARVTRVPNVISRRRSNRSATWLT